MDEDGTVHGVPVYYITTAFKGGLGKFLAGFFAVAIILALGFMGCMVQSNSIAETMNTAFGIPTWVIGLAACPVWPPSPRRSCPSWPSSTCSARLSCSS